MRVALIVILVVTSACGHRRAAAIGGMTMVGAIGMGVPLAQECSPDFRGECHHRYALPMTVGAIVGLAFGLVAAAELKDEEVVEPVPAYEVETVKPAVRERKTSRPYDPEIWGMVTPPIAPSTITPVQVPSIPLSYDCVVERSNALDRECRFELTVEDANVCECAAGFCDEPIAERCHSIEALVHVLGFATSDDRRISTAQAHAEEDAARRCFEAGGTAGDAETRCACNDDGFGTACWCVADVACSPAGAVP